MKTTKGTKQLKLDPSIYESLQKEKVSKIILSFSLFIFHLRFGIQVVVGDVIYIEANSGAVKRVGRSDAYATEFDLEVSMVESNFNSQNET